MTLSVVVFRIGSDTPDWTADDRAGKGAEVTGGRWNKKGTPLIYTSRSRALACLETVVHLGGSNPMPLNRYLVEFHIPRSVWRKRTVLLTPSVGWDAEPAGKVSIDWGTLWASSTGSAVAQVPSVIVPGEFNCLINPNHADMAKIASVKIGKWIYDGRIKR